MILSLNEIEALSRKATRGAGYPWGLAEEAGRAVRWLCVRGMDGGAVLADLLDQRDGQTLSGATPVLSGDTWGAVDGPLCPLITGAAVSDMALSLSDRRLHLSHVQQPTLMLPFVGWAAQIVSSPLTLSWVGGQAVCDGAGLQIDGQFPGPAAQLQITPGGVLPLPVSLATRAQIGADSLTRLERFANRTYAPATEASRLMGAGAGVSDND